MNLAKSKLQKTNGNSTCGANYAYEVQIAAWDSKACNSKLFQPFRSSYLLERSMKISCCILLI